MVLLTGRLRELEALDTTTEELDTTEGLDETQQRPDVTLATLLTGREPQRLDETGSLNLEKRLSLLKEIIWSSFSLQSVQEQG